jgi:hypothetical protein
MPLVIARPSVVETTLGITFQIGELPTQTVGDVVISSRTPTSYTITTSTTASSGAESIAVAALPVALDADALHRERSMSGGKNPVLAALTPGEMVLTIQQAKRFQELRLDKVLNFANGGVVGGGQNLSNEIGSKNMTINIPVTVEGGGDSSVNVPQLQNSLRSVVLAEIQKQQRPGGALNK